MKILSEIASNALFYATSGGINSFKTSVDAYLNGDFKSFSLSDIFGQRAEPFIQNRVGVIPIHGVILKDPTPMEKEMGAADIDEIGAWFDEYESAHSVERIVLDVDSPGGVVTGTPEVAEKIFKSKKETLAFTDSIAASGAYYLASQAKLVYATPSSELGSIGVYVPFFDVTNMLKMSGIKVDLIKSGDQKAAGFPGVPLSDEQRNEIQRRVNMTHDEFKQAVGRRRYLDQSFMDGRVLSGREAVRVGMSDGIVSGIAELTNK